MENLLMIVIGILTFLSIGLFFALMKEKTKKAEAEHELKLLRGQSEDQIYGRSKFSELGLMSAGITHEISNPLSIIVGRVTQLLRKAENEEMKKGLEQIKAQSDRITAIIQSI